MLEPDIDASDEIKFEFAGFLEKMKPRLACEFGADSIERKIKDFFAIGTKPISIVSYHNQFFNQTRSAFIHGSYYPALVSACALGERILNHLILDLRDFYKQSPQYRKVCRKSSFDNWDVSIETLEAWCVLLPTSIMAFRKLKHLRHRSIHFNNTTYSNVREDALCAILHLREIIDQQFSAFGDRPWFFRGTRGQIFIRRDCEEIPSIKIFYLPSCALVGPYFQFSFPDGPNLSARQLHDFPDYGDGEWTDEEFAATYEKRMPEQLVPIPLI